MFLEAEIINDLTDYSPSEPFEDKIRAAIKIECDRQHVGEDRQVMLYEAYDYVQSARHDGIMIMPFLLHAAGLIEPSNGGKFRTTPVSFNGIVGGVPPESIERAMKSWIDYFNAVLDLNNGADDDRIDRVIGEFLDIHPFSDGNGRTAWLLRVWMLNQWNDPQPLPDYYKEA